MLHVMPSLATLPVEILTNIVVYLLPQHRPPFATPYPWSKSPTRHALFPSSLLTLCLTCHRFRDIAQPLIFKSVHGTYLEKGEKTSIVSLSHTFEHCPKLATAVKDLLIRIPAFVDPEEADHRAQRLSRLVRILRSTMVLLSNVESLHLQGGRLFTSSVLSDLRSENSFYDRFVHDLSCLFRPRSLYINPTSESDDFVNLAEYSALFTHPALIKISIQSCAASCRVEDWKLRGIPHLRPNTLNLIELNLLQCHIDHDSLGILLGACRVLKVFRYQAFDRRDRCSAHRLTLGGSLAQSAALLPETFSHALQVRKDTLESLNVDFRGSFETDDDSDLTLGSLHDFERLKKISIESCRLDTFHHLPVLLEHITLTHCALEDLKVYYYAIIESRRTRTLGLLTARLESSWFIGETWNDHEFVAQAKVHGAVFQCAQEKGNCCLRWATQNMDFICSNVSVHETTHQHWRDGYDGI